MELLHVCELKKNGKRKNTALNEILTKYNFINLIINILSDILHFHVSFLENKH